MTPVQGVYGLAVSPNGLQLITLQRCARAFAPSAGVPKQTSVNSLTHSLTHLRFRPFHLVPTQAPRTRAITSMVFSEAPTMIRAARALAILSALPGECRSVFRKQCTVCLFHIVSYSLPRSAVARSPCLCLGRALFPSLSSLPGETARAQRRRASFRCAWQPSHYPYTCLAPRTHRGPHQCGCALVPAFCLFAAAVPGATGAGTACADSQLTILGITPKGCYSFFSFLIGSTGVTFARAAVLSHTTLLTSTLHVYVACCGALTLNFAGICTAHCWQFGAFAAVSERAPAGADADGDQ